MHKRPDLLAIAFGLALSGSALAQTPLDQTVATLTAQGYEIAVTQRTWLGRMRIVAVNGTTQREIVIDRTTGEVLRDITTKRTDANGG